MPVWDGQKLYQDVHQFLEAAGFIRLAYWEFNDGMQCDSVWIQPLKVVRRPLLVAASKRLREIFAKRQRRA